MAKSIVKKEFNVDVVEKKQTLDVAENVLEREIAEIKATVFLAKQFPRDVSTVREQLPETIPYLADNAYYSYPRGGATITGPSINLARELARLWGNIRYGVNIIRDTEDERTIEAWAWDIETNTKIMQQDTFKKLIYRKQLGWIKPDERDLRELTNRRAAIAVRGCILQLIPKDIVETALNIAYNQEKTKIKQMKKTSGKTEVVKRLIDAFEKINVSKEQIERYLGHSIKSITDGEIVELRGIYTSISDGHTTFEDHFKEDKQDLNLNLKDLKEEDK